MQAKMPKCRHFMEPRALNGVRSVAEPLAMSSVIHHTILKHHEAQNLRMVVTVSRRYAAVGAPHGRRGQDSRK